LAKIVSSKREKITRRFPMEEVVKSWFKINGPILTEINKGRKKKKFNWNNLRFFGMEVFRKGLKEEWVKSLLI